jgi:hypothetical protein
MESEGIILFILNDDAGWKWMLRSRSGRVTPGILSMGSRAGLDGNFLYLLGTLVVPSVANSLY